ncbi:uncharacterized protein LOC110693109 [Chenopodium quinoa]|uniref:uncharacterized protein LOC110693109 n=1 Tax=Chenopodium quinoa TaxID=63459 RepID=UPI000B773B8E|nr:uncharacterized protein LOC110693109 [Chenopodium quinoa]
MENQMNSASRFIEPTQDPCSVYYIHPADNTSLKVVSDLFNEEHYSSWKRSLILHLSTKNKMCFVDGSLPKPPSLDSKYKAWVRCNDLVIGWILGTLGPLIIKSVFFYKTAHEIWKDLEDRYGQT